MKRAFTQRAVLAAVSLAALATLGGCPIYSHDDDGCWRDRDCASGFFCDDRSGICYRPGSGTLHCARPADCGVNETCGKTGRCVTGDCSFSGCVTGYVCDNGSGIWQCVVLENGSAGAGGDVAAGDGNESGAGNLMSGASGAAGSG
jgi:hypothetical protein